MPVDSSKIIENIRRKAGLESDIPEIVAEQQGPLIQIEAEEEAMREPLIESAGETYGRPISVCFAGVGTCGVNILMSLKAQNSTDDLVDFVGINSDGGSIKELEKNGFKNNIALSMGDSYYLGAGGDLEVAKELGDKYYDHFKKRFRNVDLALVVTGMGGGTGTGVAPLVAKAAKEVQNNKKNTLTIGVATMPAGIEADRREIAMHGIEELKKYVDALIVIDQRNLLDVLNQENASMDEADDLIDSRFEIVLQSIMDTVTNYTKRNIDFADICSTLKASGESIITTVEAPAGNVEDIKKELAVAISDKLLVNHSNKIASRLMIYQFYEQGYSERAHYEVVSEVQRLFNWTKGDDGYYRCVLENPPEDTVRFLKIGNGSSDEYKGRTRVIVMAGGFVNKTSVSKISTDKTLKIEVPPLKIEPIRQTQKIPQPQPQIQMQEISSIEELLNGRGFSL
jgi:cell division protein FtsZ